MMENVNLIELQKMVNKAKYIFIWAPALDAHVEVKKFNIKEIVKNQIVNLNNDPHLPYCTAELDGDELTIDTLLY